MYSPKLTGPLDFNDWLQRRGNRVDSGWIVVGEVWKTATGQASTFTYLVSLGSLRARLKSEIRGCDSSSAQTEIVEAYIENRAYGSRPDRTWDNDGPVDVDKRPFVIETTSFGYKPLQLDFVQAFILYWNAWWDGDVLRRLDDAGILHDVARRTREDENVRLEADAHHLRSFLAVIKCGALRVHDHMRFTRGYTPMLIDEIFSDSTGHFRRIVDRGDIAIVKYAFFGRANGKDVVLPYMGQKGDPREAESGQERFITGRAADGSSVEASSCDKHGNAHFLTPVYFRPEVLRRYYDAPNRYSVETGYLRCLDRWSVRFERRTDDLVEIYLGDLGNIPYADQRHFRAYNVHPPGTGISDERFRRDFMVEWINPQSDPTFDFKTALEGTNRAAVRLFGKPMFRPLTEKDAHVIDGLRVPVSESPEESDAQIVALAKITADSLDVDLLRANVAPGTDTKDMKSDRKSVV